MRYLFQRKEGGNWYVRLQPPGQKLVERSLGTSDQKAAEIATADLIKQHEAFMYQRRQARVASVVHGPWAHEYTPGLHTLLDGHVMATETDLTFSDGTRRPNGEPAIHLTGTRLSAAREFQAFDDAYDGKIGAVARLGALIAASCRECSWRAAAEAPLFGLVIILQRNHHQPLQRPQRSERDDQDRRKPQDGVDPIRRVVNCFRDQGGADNENAGQKHDENRRPVTESAKP